MRTFTILLLLPVLLLNGCGDKEDTTPDPAPYEGSVTAIHNGKAWSGSIYGGTYNNRLTIRIDKLSPSGVRTENWFFEQLQPATGTQILEPVTYDANSGEIINEGAYSLYRKTDGDAVVPWYDLLTGAPHAITITAYDTGSGQISGTFEASYASQGSDPDTVVWTNGQFQTRIRK